ncbi:MAG: sugar ABC transporter permease, partial [Nitrospiraceae bacterium]
ARLNFPGRNVLFFFVLATLMIPTEMTIVPLFIGFLRLKLVDNYAAFILPSIASVFSVYLFRQFFLSLPREIEDAARVDGAGRFRIFFSIALPLARPAVI